MNKPFLKWPGSKYRLAPRILPHFPAGKRFVEPFAGAAGIFLNASFQNALVCDANPDLIGLYAALQQHGADFAERCRALFTPENNNREAYYRLRADFNASGDPLQRAVLFLYLNRHAYNGMVRYNSRFIFNVPFGRYTTPRFPAAEMDIFMNKLRETATVFRACDFRETFRLLEAGDVVYCDPPYVPLSATASFTSYAGTAFGAPEQEELAQLALNAAQQGITVIISNHDTEATRRLYCKASSITGFTVRRSISCKGAERGHAPELLAVFAPRRAKKDSGRKIVFDKSP